MAAAAKALSRKLAANKARLDRLLTELEELNIDAVDDNLLGGQLELTETLFREMDALQAEARAQGRLRPKQDDGPSHGDGGNSRQTEDQAREVPTNAAERTLPGSRRNAARDWYRPREDSSRPKVAHAPMREGGVANPLHALTKKGEKWHWGRKEEEAFTRLKEALVSPPILVHPDFDRTFLLDVDASEDAVGAVLSQQGGQDPPAVIAYASRSLSRAERGYCATRREMLALVWATQHFRPYLYGRRFIARTDHNSLRWLRNFREPEGQVARWLERLAEFDFEVVHRAGRKHQNADALSRRVCKQCGLEGSPAEVPVGAVKLDAANPIKQWQESDKELQQIREWSTQRTWPQVAPEGSRLLRSLWSQRDRIVVHEGTICRKWETPDTGETRLLQVIPRQRIPEILAAIHNQQSWANLGVAKTLAKLRQRYYWPQQREDVEDWCRACQTCAARAVPTKKPQAPMQLQPVGYPFQRVGMDIVGPLEDTPNGNRYILMVCDYFSKWPEAFTLPNAKARTVAAALVNGLFCRYVAPETLHSDQGRNFESELVKEVCQLFGVAKTRTTAYHPQSDGLVERMNRTSESSSDERCESQWTWCMACRRAHQRNQSGSTLGVCDRTWSSSTKRSGEGQAVSNGARSSGRTEKPTDLYMSQATRCGCKSQKGPS
ncbi:Transposon Ty3-G Gag-Pol polyprotein [Trichinella patagoniensis]|uniref:RNA-directed DNA polymerase n=1 Tax=Trichinella patagoniensis TaxID=990121 RepID=A0A0V1AH52_9BILA|nr:Transposon Ty3-G Gag-Pol polyprotein [Trichinella patagoniensis]